MLALRVGDASTVGLGPGTALPLYLDEYDTTGTLSGGAGGSSLVQSVAVPPTTCKLAKGRSATMWYDTEGFPAISTDGLAVSFVCYRNYPAVGAAVVDEHRAVAVHVHERAGLVVIRSGERDAEFDGADGESAVEVGMSGVEGIDLMAALGEVRSSPPGSPVKRTSMR